MIGVYAHAIVKAEHASAFERIARTLVEKSTGEEGLVSYHFGPLIAEESDANQREFAFIERWSSIEALEDHMMTDHYKQADLDHLPYLASPMQISIYEIQE